MTIHDENIDALNQIVPLGAAIAVVPDNGNDLPRGVCRALWVGVGGDLELDFNTHDQAGLPSDQIVIKNVSSGELLPFEVKRVRATLTTATFIVAFY